MVKVHRATDGGCESWSVVLGRADRAASIHERRDPLTWNEALELAAMGHVICPMCDEMVGTVATDRGILGGWWPFCCCEHADEYDAGGA